MSNTPDIGTYRHQCEVRVLLRGCKSPGREWVENYLNDPKVKGRRAQLADDLNAQRKLGNTGKEGEWL